MTLEKTLWIRKIEDALKDTLSIPLWGEPPPFPWEALSRHLARLLHVDHVKLLPGAAGWTSSRQLTTGLGTRPVIFSLALSPLQGSLFWIFSSEDLPKLTTHALSSNKKIKGFSDTRLQEGFYRFLSLEVLQKIEELKPFPELALHMAEEAMLPEEGLCIDVGIQLSDRQTLWGRIVCSPELHRSFKTHFSQQRPPLLSYAIAKELDVGVSLTIGKTAIPINAWKQAASGDLLLLDRCSYDLTAQKGNGTLFLNKAPLFQIKIKGDALKVLDYAFYHEENIAMENKTPEEGNEEMEFEGELQSLPEHLWEVKEEQELSSEKLIPTQDVPFVLNVEIARLKMSLEKLLKLQPGNVLDLSIRPEQGVYLTVGGKRVAKGELVKLGEIIGVKILQIGE